MNVSGEVAFSGKEGGDLGVDSASGKGIGPCFLRFISGLEMF